MATADDIANTATLLDAHLRAGHIEWAGDAEDGEPCYRVTQAGLDWALQVIAASDEVRP